MESQKLLPLILNYKVLNINFTVISINNTVNNINYIPQFDLCTVFKSIEPTILRYVDFPARSLLTM
jgi:hypothetical protein